MSDARAPMFPRPASVPGGRRRSPLVGARNVALGLGGLVLAACGGGGGSGTGANVGPEGNAQLVRLEFGRLVDVYGLRDTSEGLTLSLFREDVVIGPDIQDQRDTGDNRPDSEILYDFISANSDNLQPRLFIPREIGSEEFRVAVMALDDKLREIAPAELSQNTAVSPFSVVPRNAAIRLTFSRNLGIGDSFFVERDENGNVIGLRNNEAVQLLNIVGDPNGPNATAAFEVLPVRLVVRDNALIIDPVLLGTEGLQYQTRNNAAGLPESPNQAGANIRLAIALEGPLALGGVTEDSSGGLIGINNSGFRSIIRDFRSGNRNDNSPDMSSGFVRDPIPPRIVGEIVMYLEQVVEINEFVQELTVYKHGVVHEIDRGDVIKLIPDNSGIPVAVTEVVADPVDDRGRPEVGHVRLRARFVPGLADIDPRRLPGYPSNVAEREPWLVANAPKAILVSEFSAGGRTDPTTNRVIADDPRYFVTFAPSPPPRANGTPSEPNENISPFAGAVIRFTKPVNLDTVKSLDTFFFATRDLFDTDEMENFIAARDMDPAAFLEEKYWTPHLIFSRVFDENGSQTALRLQPTLGFYLDDRMRNPMPTDDFRYFMHLLGGGEGIQDLAGNPVDFQADTVAAADSLVIPFTLDTRVNVGGQPFFEDNLVVSVARRFAGKDEDEQPSYHLPDDIQLRGIPNPRAFNLDDLFGGISYPGDGTMAARPTSRVTKVADNLNQPPVPPQSSPRRWCPDGPEPVATARTPFGAGIQNPLNPFGCRLQTVWREIDLGLSRVDPFDFNLDVEQMYWAPFTGSPSTFDQFDRVTLFLGHSEFRAEQCTDGVTPRFPSSGLNPNFADNYVFNPRGGVRSEKETQPAPHPAYVDAPLVIEPNDAVLEPNGINRFMPLPEFRRPYFVFRDETVLEQGANSSFGSDTDNGVGRYAGYIISPWLFGRGRKVTQGAGGLQFEDGFWLNSQNYNLGNRTQFDVYSGGLVGSIALPLLGDFWTYCDSPDLPAGNGYIALGTNGWQISLTVQTAPTPAFRAYSGGRPPGISSQPPLCRGPGDPQWGRAAGGFGLGGTTTRALDNSFYWVMIDFLKRSTVVTNGFVDILNPHRVPPNHPDTRLGPYLANAQPNQFRPSFSHDFQPPLDQLPGGTSVVVQFRGASAVDDAPWRWVEDGMSYDQPDAVSFPLDPLKAGDAHIRKWDDRPLPGGTTARNWWTHFYNRTVTGYVEELNTLMDPGYTGRFSGPNESFTPDDVRYFNWRFLMTNNVEANPPVSPTIDTFAVTYRFEPQR